MTLIKGWFSWTSGGRGSSGVGLWNAVAKQIVQLVCFYVRGGEDQVL